MQQTGAEAIRGSGIVCDHCGCRSYAPIAELTAEHERILALAWSLAEAARSDHPTPASHTDALLDLLDAHVAKEEAGLYPVLVTLEGITDVDRDQLELEHHDLRRSITEGAFDRRNFYALAAHIEVEDLELFATAMLRFDERDWDEVAAVHSAVDSEAAQSSRRPSGPSWRRSAVSATARAERTR